MTADDRHEPVKFETFDAAFNGVGRSTDPTVSRLIEGRFVVTDPTTIIVSFDPPRDWQESQRLLIRTRT